jgi:hypothetical protein
VPAGERQENWQGGPLLGLGVLCVAIIVGLVVIAALNDERRLRNEALEATHRAFLQIESARRLASPPPALKCFGDAGVPVQCF